MAINNDAWSTAQAASVDSYTQCGHACDWSKQAGHFAAEAALASVDPGDGASVPSPARSTACSKIS